MAALTGGSDQVDSRQQLLDVGVALLKDFIFERVRRFGDPGTMVTRDMLGGGELCDPHLKKVGQCLQQIGDDLDGNAQLQSLMKDSSLRPCKEVFIEVACAIFSDGKFNWGRVVALFYFACRLVIKAVMTKVPDIIRTIISWTIDYMRDHVIAWIRQQGGWILCFLESFLEHSRLQMEHTVSDGIMAYIKTPTWQTVGVFLAGVLATVVVMNRI